MCIGLISTPVDETVDAMGELVKEGKVRQMSQRICDITHLQPFEYPASVVFDGVRRYEYIFDNLVYGEPLCVHTHI